MPSIIIPPRVPLSTLSQGSSACVCIYVFTVCVLVFISALKSLAALWTLCSSQQITEWEAFLWEYIRAAL